jgi:hypothetical protein
MVHRGVAKYNLSLYLSFYGLHRQVGEWDVKEALSYVLAVMVSIFLDHLDQYIFCLLSGILSPTNFRA